LLYINPKLKGGSVTYALKLIKEISRLDITNTYVIYINKESKDLDFNVGDNCTFRVLNFEYKSAYLRYYWEQCILPYYLFKDKIDILHSLGYVTPLFTRAKKVVSILDINYKGHSNNMSSHKRFLLGLMVNLSAIFSHKIITISEFSKRQIVKYTKAKEEKIVVTLLSGSSDEQVVSQNENSLKEKYGIKNKYIIAFSSPSPHKNIASLIEALHEELQFNHQLQLVLVGHKDKNETLDELINNYSLSAKIVFTGFVPNEEIGGLISNADLFVFPSLYEGFGIPLLDAQSYGVPVVSSNAGSLPEVGGNAALYFDPYDINEIRSVIIKALKNTSNLESLVEKGIENRKSFSWSKTALETLDVYKKLYEK
tara:strand:- start:2263 stop:3366 length:1104 start_codon:yes stop_codon:yes gene_type:complete